MKFLICILNGGEGIVLVQKGWGTRGLHSFLNIQGDSVFPKSVLDLIYRFAKGLSPIVFLCCHYAGCAAVGRAFAALVVLSAHDVGPLMPDSGR